MWFQLAGIGVTSYDQRSHISSIRIRFAHDRPIHVAGGVEDWTNSSNHGVFHDAGVRLKDAAGICGGRGRSVWALNRTDVGADVWGAVVRGVRLLHGELERAKADGRRRDDRA
jgi:hypothetical protein